MSKELEVAKKAASAAGPEIMKRFGNLSSVRDKGKNLGLVTDADIVSQEKIKGIILSEFPDAKFLAEEDEPKSFAFDECWVIDPIDGTKNFVCGVKGFAVSIGLLKKRSPVLGVILNPATGDLFYSEKGAGAFLNGKPIKVSSQAETEDSLFCIDLPRREHCRERNFSALKKIFGKMGELRIFGSAALQLAFVAAGQLDAYLEAGLYPWDTGAGVLLVEEAGGRVTNEKGESFRVLEHDFMVASNGKIHDAVLEELNKK